MFDSFVILPVPFCQVYKEKLAKVLETTAEYILGQEGEHGKLEHLPEQLREWIFNPKSVSYLAKAYMEYQQDQMNEFLNK